jgi:hypothetical protein
LEAAGIEPPQQFTGNVASALQSGAESGALGARNDLVDPDLEAVVEEWPTLAEPIKVGILAIIRAAK